jgi:hypothetical protein
MRIKVKSLIARIRQLRVLVHHFLVQASSLSVQLRRLCESRATATLRKENDSE